HALLSQSISGASCPWHLPGSVAREESHRGTRRKDLHRKRYTDRDDFCHHITEYSGGTRVTALGSVLIVEDDSALRQSLRSTLEAAGFCPREASSGEEAILALRNSKFETILLDINMPGIGGMESCRRIRQMYPLLPILVLTVRDEEKDKIEALDAGADDYITKPFQFLELTARLRSAIRRFRARNDSPE